MEIYTWFQKETGRASVMLNGRHPEEAGAHCHRLNTTSGGEVAACAFMSNALDLPGNRGGCYSGNVSVESLLTAFEWRPNDGAIKARSTSGGPFPNLRCQ